MLVASAVTWRRGQYYAGGIDPVVAAKGALDVLAAIVATAHTVLGLRRRFLRSTATVWFLTAFVVITLFGALHTGSTLAASAVLAVRLVVISVACFALLLGYSARDVLRVLLFCLGLVTVLAVVTGNPITAISDGVESSRLAGGTPPLGPNEISELSGFVVIGLTWLFLQGQARLRGLVGIIAFTALVYLSGSRTGLVALAAAVIVMIVLARRLPLGVVIAVYSAIPVLVYLLFGTSVASRYFGRGGSANLDTLNSRSVAWDAALGLHHGGWEVWFGNGLSQTVIPVTSAFRTQQILDSSWVSALVQGGILAVIVLVVWVVYGLRVALRCPLPVRGLAAALMLYVVLRTFLESGLPDATPAYLVFFVLCVGGGGLSMARTDSRIDDEMLPPRRRVIPETVASVGPWRPPRYPALSGAGR
jgi:hypothetical protein